MTLTKDEKSSRYDSLTYAIDIELKGYEKKIKELDEEINHANENLAGLLIGRKYAYIEFAETLKRWC